MKQGPPERGPKILSLGEFTNPYSDGRPRYGNLWVNFDVGYAATIYQGTAHYKRFAEENSEMNESLQQKIQSRKRDANVTNSLKPFEKDLYEAYKIMRTYGLSDTEIFA